MERLCIFAFLVGFGLTAAEDARWGSFSQPGWRHGDKPVADMPMAVILALKQRNTELLKKRAERVSDPMDPEYGRYMSGDEVAALARPSTEDIENVKAFLAIEGGAYRFSKAQDFVIFTGTVASTERLFGTTLLLQEGPLTPPFSRIRAATPITLPTQVANALDGVSLNAPIFMPRRPKPSSRLSYVYPASGRAPPRIAPRVIAGDGVLMFSFVAYCKDGSANRDSLKQGACSSQGDEHAIVTFEALVVQEPHQQKIVQLPAVNFVLGEREGNCGEGISCMEFNASIGDINNYMSTRVVIRALFNDGSTTFFSNVSEVRPAWPVPYTTPDFLSRFYRIPRNLPIKHPRNAIAVAEFLGQYYNPDDLESFFRIMGVRTWPETARPLLLGPDLPQAGSVLGAEAQLDIQYIMAMASNVSTWFWSVPGKELATTQEPFLHWLMQVADHEESTVPLVHSVSYADDEDSVPRWFLKRVDNEFMKLALRGISVLVASGDDGASGYLTRNGNTQFCDRSRPTFPASSPWVTAVGGTQLSILATDVCGYASDTMVVNCKEEGEVACSSNQGGVITSGGGFSNHYPRPWYQGEAVSGYLKQSDSPLPSPSDSWFFNRSGRAYPDISAVANNYLIWMGDGLESTSGTSASTPLIAAMVAHWNEQRLQHGKPPLGFLNPLLYRLAHAHPEAFSDVIVGDNRCGLADCCEKGFGAARGWDATTGIGSPKFDVLSALLQPTVTQESHADMSFSATAASISQQTWTPWAVPSIVMVALVVVGISLGARKSRAAASPLKTQLLADGI